MFLVTGKGDFGMMGRKPIPIGIDFYKEIIDEGYYYVDKTLLIRDLLDQKNKVTLFTRPRRFGKTLNQTMLCTFFEKEVKPDGSVADNTGYFKGKKIMDAGKKYTDQMGRYPVILLSMKSAKQPNYGMARQSIISGIMAEFDRHSYILDGSFLKENAKERYRAVMNGKAGDFDYATSIAFLSACLCQFHSQKVIMLLDEYDVPLENAYFNGFYNEMTVFIRSLFESALKTNPNLYFAVITGCLRISKESIFTGLNHLKVVSVLDRKYAEYFGFTQQEVDRMLAFYGIPDRRDEVKSWYDGYLFGQTEVYNPWSVINYVDDVINENVWFPKPYWPNTSSNSIVRELIERSDNKTRRELESLVGGGMIEKPTHEEITYGDIHRSSDSLWDFLFFTGYLKAVSRRFDGHSIFISLKIPNKEVLYVYETQIREWMGHKVRAMDLTGLYRAILDGDVKVFEGLLKKLLRDSISYMDSAEKFYHGFLLGLVEGIQGYELLSNRESGDGRYDIVMKPYDICQPAVILELKYTKNPKALENLCNRALRQIDDRHYDDGLLREGYLTIKKYGICFCKKTCAVKMK